jgi:alkaline phosphatase
MISDGASIGAWDMASLQQHGQRVSPALAYNNFPVKVLMETVPLNTSNTPTGGNTQQVFYDPAQAWDATPGTGSAGSYPNYFKGYEYLRKNAVDSAAAGTALASGVKTYNNAINWGNDPANTGTQLRTVWENAHDNGMVLGTISSVPFSHATPAAFGAHNISRNNYAAIAGEMIESGKLSVVMGAGHPWFNDNNQPRSTPSQSFMTTAQYTALQNGTAGGGTWRFIENKSDFQALADGTLNLQGKNRVFGLAKVGSTLQQSRSGYAPTDAPFSDPFNGDVPDLPTMSLGTLRMLKALSDQTGNGFFVQIEGGAIDWAAHGNQTSRIIEEQVDFNNAVNAVVNWIETVGGGWDNNLLIVTTDHGNSMPMGPDSNTIFHDRIELADITGAPSVRWHHNSHTTELVPLFAKGVNAEMFYSLVDGTDTFFGSLSDAARYADWVGIGFDGRYISNTDVFTVMNAVVPEPTTVGLLGLAGLAMLGHRHRRA